ncbi:MAG: alpha/beta fold hydrolase [Ramlibacter sp.]|nr:alpha/beta fold hydrolase [Ramlibacter sp.]
MNGPAGIRTVLFLHAGGENREVWQPIASAVGEQGWRTVAVDLRGHGESGRAPRYRFDDFILDVAQVHGKLCAEPLVIVGSSIGGALGLIVAGERHAPVAGLVLLDTPTRPKPAIALGKRNRLAAAQSLGARALSQVDPAFFLGTFIEEVVADLGRWQRAAKSVHVPVLLIAGERSTDVGPKELEAMKKDLPQLEVVSAPASHLVARDCPHEVTAHLKRFLADQRLSGVL